MWRTRRAQNVNIVQCSCSHTCKLMKFGFIHVLEPKFPNLFTSFAENTGEYIEIAAFLRSRSHCGSWARINCALRSTESVFVFLQKNAGFFFQPTKRLHDFRGPYIQMKTTIKSKKYANDNMADLYDRKALHNIHIRNHWNQRDFIFVILFDRKRWWRGRDEGKLGRTLFIQWVFLRNSMIFQVFAYLLITVFFPYQFIPFYCIRLKTNWLDMIFERHWFFGRCFDTPSPIANHIDSSRRLIT